MIQKIPIISGIQAHTFTVCWERQREGDLSQQTQEMTPTHKTLSHTVRHVLSRPATHTSSWTLVRLTAVMYAGGEESREECGELCQEFPS